MTWQVVWTRSREGIARLRGRFNLGFIGRFIVGTMALGLLAIIGEAWLRARIDPAHARVPSGIYTRPNGWGDEDRDHPMVIGTVSGAPAELRIPVDLDQVPDHLVDAILAVEDKRFHRHHGLDFRRIGGALVANLRAGRITQGGSTVTQQLAKNLFLTADRTPVRKVREAAIALVLESTYDKATILEAYLNEIYLGQDGGLPIHGVAAAARYYFGKRVGKLSLAEGALLAGMIQAPNRYSPVRNPESAERRRNLVLGLMAEQGRISRRGAERARRTRVGTRPHPTPTLDARYFRDLIVSRMPRGVPARGAALFTTLDPTLQRAAVRAVRDGSGRLRAAGAQAAFVAIDPRTGDVLAMVGGRDYGASQFNRAVDARRQPGSAFKPIVALAALHREPDRDPLFTLASVVEDEPLSLRTRAGRWEPSNYDGAFRGEVTVRQAIEQSLNVPFVRIGLAVGPDRIVRTARRLGFSSPLRAVPSLALGSSEVTLLELVRAYGVFATGGYLATTRTVLGRGTAAGGRPDPDPPEITRVVDPAEAYLVTSALQGVIERGTGRALAARGWYGGLAGKTGTSNDWRDAWFVAYSPSLAIGAWVGFDDGRSLGQSGAEMALPIVARFLDLVRLDGGPGSFPVPDGVEFARVGGESGWSWDCGSREVFLEGTAPESECDDYELPDWERRVAEWRREVEWSREIGTRTWRIVTGLWERLNR